MTPLRPAQLVAGTGLVVVAGLEFRSLFGVSELIGPVVVAGVACAALTVLVHVVGRRRLVLEVLASVVGFAAVASVAVFDASPTPATLADLGDAFVNGWARVLSISPPVPAEPSLVFVAALVTWVAAFLTIEFTVRSRHPMLPLLPPTACFATAVALGVDGRPYEGRWVAALIALAALLVSLRRTSRGVGRRAVATLAVVGAIAMAAPQLTPHLPLAQARESFDPRDYRYGPAQPGAVVSPLARIPTLLARGDATMFTVRAAEGRRWRLAVLDQYDGTGWTSDSTYDAAGSILPPAAEGPRPTGRLEQQITVDGLDGLFLPAADRPVEVSGTDVQYDRETGVLVSRNGDARGQRYEVRSEFVEPSLQEMTRARVTSGSSMREFVVLPRGLPEEIRDVATDVTRGATYGLQELLLLEEHLRENFTFDPKVTGHAYGHLRFFLGVSARGSSEQFAAAFAVMARSLGHPARVAVGFEAGAHDQSTSTFTVRGSDAYAWPEVHIRGWGWIAFDVEPPRGEILDSEEAGAGVAEARAKEEITLAAKQNAAYGLDRGTTAEDGGAGGWSWKDVAIVGAIGAVGMAALAVAARFGSRRLRRRLRLRGRRGRREPRARVVGAWEEVREVLERRAGSMSTLAPNEVPVHVEQSLGPGAGEQVRELAGMATLALYSGDAIGEPDGDRAWELVGTIRRTVTSGRGRAS